jgi:ribosomal protein S8E
LVDAVVERSAAEFAESSGVPKPDWRLVSVFWKETAPESSLATIQIGPEPTNRKYVSVGDTVLNGTVIKMAKSAVTIAVDGQEFEFGLGEGGEAAVGAVVGEPEL